MATFALFELIEGRYHPPTRALANFCRWKLPAERDMVPTHHPAPATDYVKRSRITILHHLRRLTKVVITIVSATVQ